MAAGHERSGSYPFSFGRVTTALWDKYEGHQQVSEVEVLERHVNPDGTLYSRRLLTMYGNLPYVLRPLFGAKPLYLEEEITADAKTRELEVRTRNINFTHVFVSQSVSHYRASSNDPDATEYAIQLQTTAFPKEGGGSRGGRLAGLVEDFACRKILGNVRQGEADIIRAIRAASGPEAIWAASGPEPP